MVQKLKELYETTNIYQYLLFLSAFVVIYGFRLRSIAPALLPEELATLENTYSAINTSDFIQSAPFAIVQRLFVELLPEGSMYAVRLPSLLFGLIAVSSFFFIVKNLSQDRYAYTGTLLFGLSSFMLHGARTATPQIYLIALALTLGALLVHLNKNKDYKLSVILFAGTLLPLYTPGGWPITVLAMVGFWFTYKNQEVPFKSLKSAVYLTVLVAVLAPLVYIQLSHDPLLANSLCGCKELQVRAPLNAFKSMFFEFRRSQSLWVGKIPILDAASTLLVMLGVLRIGKDYKSKRAMVLVGSLILGVAVSLLGGVEAGLIVLVPTVYLLVSYGFQVLSLRWKNTFPTNPAAESLGSILLALIILLIVNHHMQRYFVVWTQRPETIIYFEQNN